MKTNENFNERLNKLEWPAIYPFKFIVPIDQLDSVLVHFQLQETTIRLSKKGNYASVSATPFLLNPDKVLEVYDNVSKIKGLISL